MLKTVLTAAILYLLCFANSARAAEGLASWYDHRSGTETASGERFDENAMTCAMRTHQWRWVTVTVISTGKTVLCRVNDFGPAAWTGRLIDVSAAVARHLDFVRAGVVRVSVE